MHFHVSIREDFWDKLWPGQILPSPVTAVAVLDNRFSVEWHELIIVDVGHNDTDDSTVVSDRSRGVPASFLIGPDGRHLFVRY
jgi:hypothetical protein